MAFVKVKPRITFKVTSTSGRGMSGIGTRYWLPLLEARVPVGIMSIDATGPITELLGLARQIPGYDLINDLYLHYRITGIHQNEGRFVDVPDYSLPPIQAAVDDYLFHYGEWQKRFGVRFESVKPFCWFGINNEPDQTRSEWLAEYSLQQLKMAAIDGIKLAVFAWSTGTPDYPAWDGPKMRELLNYLRQHRDTAAIDLHEYSLNTRSLDAPDLMGRWRKIPQLWDVSLIFSEWGWAEREMPPRSAAMWQIRELYPSVLAWPNVIGCAGWTLDSSWGDLWATWNSMFEDIVTYTLATSWEVATEEEPNKMENYIYNGDWTKGWRKVSASSLEMNGWKLDWDAGQVSDISGEVYDYAEWTVKSREQLPPNEWEYLNPVSNVTYKVFGGNVPFKTSMTQEVADLVPGKKYMVIVRAVMDAYNVVNKQRVYTTVDEDQTVFKIKANGKLLATFRPAAVGPDEELAGPVPFVTETYFVAEDVNEVSLHFQSEWGISCNYFLKDVALYEMEEDLPDPPTTEKHKAIVVKVKQGATLQDWMAAASLAYDFRHTFTASHDDMLTILRGGNDQSYVKLVGGRDAQPDVAKLIEDSGYTWVPVLENSMMEFRFNSLPVTSSPAVVTQEFGANPQNYAKFGLPGHEGVDFRAALGDPILSVAAGVVKSVVYEDVSYGTYVRIDHANGWQTTYAHLSSVPETIVPGKTVGAGVAIGKAGSTGNSTGTHLHLTLKRIGYFYTDPQGVPWPRNVFDPTPFLKEFDNIQWPGGSPGIPPTEKHDVGSAFLPVGLGPVITLRHVGGPHNGHEEHTQLKGALLVKDNNYEEVWVEGDYIMRRIDTSPTDSEWYVLTDNGQPHRWMPRMMAVGQIYERNPLVEFFYKDLVDGSVEPSRSPYRHATRIRLAEVRDTMRVGSDEVGPVFVVEALNLNGVPFERTFYAEGVGMVRWENVSVGWHTEAIRIDRGVLDTPAPPDAVRVYMNNRGWSPK